MRLEKLFFPLLLMMSGLNVQCQQNESNDRVGGWSSDIDYLLEQIKTQHYIFKSRSLPQAMTRKAQALKKNIAGYSDERMLIEMERLAFYAGDGHTYILPFAAKITHSHYLPLQFYNFQDGFFVISAEKEYRHLVGARVKMIGKTLPATMMKDMESFISQDNVQGANWIGPFFLRFRGMLESYGLPAGSASISLTLEDRIGRQFEQKVNFVPVPSLRGIPKMVPSPKDNNPMWLTAIQKNYWYQYLPDKKTLYVQFNQVQSDQYDPLENFIARLKKEADEKNPKLLVLDVRHNNGGNGDLTPPFVAMLKEFESNHPASKLVVITGRNTFSAAQIFISRIDAATNAVFAGEMSSSSPNFVGEENMVMLPFSGAMGSVSNRYHENIPGDKRKWIEPDIKVLLTSTDYFENRDPVLEAIFKKYL